ncbi:MAG: hypothetical protein HOC60_08130 [Rhodospirillaceae bacterium]|nr:hypothetical protein [Rhodospirillaceae bacterium]
MVADDDPTPADQDGPEDDTIVPDPTDAIEFEPIERTSPKRTGLIVFLALLVLGGGAGAAWYYKDTLLKGADMDEFPIIRAVEGPVKVRPENPGGMNIPDRDKLVYDRMKGATKPPRLERLLPPAETPLAPPAPKPEPPKVEPAKVEKPKAEMPKIEAKPDLLNSVPESKPVPKPAPKAVAKAEPKPIVKPVVKPDPKPASAPTPVAKAVPSPIQQPTTLPDTVKTAQKPSVEVMEPEQPPQTDISSFAYKVQLGAVRSEELAANEWKRLLKKNNDLLGSYSMTVVRADLGPGKGVYFRLRAGPIAGEDVARALCKNLVERKVACLIVRPGD